MDSHGSVRSRIIGPTVAMLIDPDIYISIIIIHWVLIIYAVRAMVKEIINRKFVVKI